MEPDVSFVGVKLEPGVKTKLPVSLDLDNSIWTIHITQFALAHPAKSGKNVISLINLEEEEFVLGTLEKDRCEQFQGDFMLAEAVQLINHGKTAVHLTGYQTTTDVMDDGMMMSDDDQDLEDGLPARRVRRLAQMNGIDLEGSSGDESEDEDFDSEGGGSSEADDEDDDPPEAIPLQKLTQAKAKGRKGAIDDKELSAKEEKLMAEAGLEVEDDSEEEEEEGSSSDEEEDDEDEDEDDEEQPEPLKTSTVQKKQKRQSDSSTEPPTSSKKIKLTQAPATSEKPSQSEGDKEWLKLMKAYVAKEGPTTLSELGSRVKKPAGAGKLKKVVEECKELKLEEDRVILVK